jgi:broad specificity phosphatase PhoE
VVREHFRLLREALLAWAENRTQPEGMPDWQTFQSGAVGALIEARQRFPGGNVLIVSSGGPIAAMVAAALNAPPATAIELNLRIRNSSLTEFASTPRRHHLLSFNGLPHLDTNADATLTTYA